MKYKHPILSDIPVPKIGHSVPHLVITSKGGQGPIGSRRKAPEGKYIHERVSEPPPKKGFCRTIRRGGKLMRVCKNKPGEKMHLQAVLTPIKKS